MKKTLVPEQKEKNLIPPTNESTYMIIEDHDQENKIFSPSEQLPPDEFEKEMLEKFITSLSN